MAAMTQSMQWISALSTRPSLEAAVNDVIEQTQRQLHAAPDLAFVFISSAFASEYSRLMPLLQAAIDVPVWIGCSGGGVVGVDANGQIQEIEGQAALSLTLASLPDVAVHAFHLGTDELPDLDSPPDAWIQLIGVAAEAQPDFVLLAAPTSPGVTELLQGLDFAYPGSVKVGGLASVNSLSGASGLFCNDRYYPDGIVGVALSGNIVMETIVAQGCRPIGQPYRVAAAERNILTELEENTEADETCGLARTPLEVLQGLFQELDESDRELAQHSLFVGVAQSSFKQQLEQGDFLIRNLIGVDPKTGAIAVGDRIRPGQRIQFHLRDSAASAEDLRTLLARYQMQSRSIVIDPSETDRASPVGALMFSCMGRGEGLYEQPNFDSQLFSQYLNQVPLSGFFCNGEIGPVGNTTFLHGYTSVFGICRAAVS
ncbi:MAG: FIST C-terminal domain-containing protein [Elainella sp. Prado103]|jgi:small ligand-binding sensory domain FIST|nr:FIST C-terminal domain-containing protein [Elainella sp. Prado103]